MSETELCHVAVFPDVAVYVHRERLPNIRVAVEDLPVSIDGFWAVISPYRAEGAWHHVPRQLLVDLGVIRE